ncbi:MAG: response regulator [Acidobacteria bacterium]|nr:response regulator [Acidobacteriota bacterium]
MPVKILLVDDDVEFLNSVKSVVQPLRWCEVSTLSDSREAARFLESEKLDGLLVNARMPHLNGFQLTEVVRKSSLNSGVPIVMLTKEDDVEVMRQGFRTGITFFMAKPTSREHVYTLFSAVRGAMDSEKRKHARLPYRTRVQCEWGEHGERRFTADSLDIGEGGISLKPSGGLDVGQEVKLTFVLPQSYETEKMPEAKLLRRSMFSLAAEIDLTRPQRLLARVRHRPPSDAVGLEFSNLPATHRAAIQRYIVGASQD